MDFNDLEKLYEMKEKGIISDAEFQLQKDKIFSPKNIVPKQSETMPIWAIILIVLAVVMFVLLPFIGSIFSTIAWIDYV